MRVNFIAAFVCIAIASPVFAAEQPKAVTPSPVPPDRTEAMLTLDAKQVLGPGDKVSFRVLEDQDEPRSLTITDSGELDVPYFGLVQAAGKTSRQLAREIKTELEKQLYRRATVVIAVELVNKARVTGKVYVTGRVRNEGGFEIPAGETLTVSKAILNAGGFSDFSDKKHVRLVRKVGGAEKTYIINVVEIWEKSKLEKDIVVKPDDTIIVPARVFNY